VGGVLAPGLPRKWGRGKDLVEEQVLSDVLVVFWYDTVTRDFVRIWMVNSGRERKDRLDGWLSETLII
jgi:hypothetical protein